MRNLALTLTAAILIMSMAMFTLSCAQNDAPTDTAGENPSSKPESTVITGKTYDENGNEIVGEFKASLIGLGKEDKSVNLDEIGGFDDDGILTLKLPVSIPDSDLASTADLMYPEKSSKDLKYRFLSAMIYQEPTPKYDPPLLVVYKDADPALYKNDFIQYFVVYFNGKGKFYCDGNNHDYSVAVDVPDAGWYLFDLFFANNGNYPNIIPITADLFSSGDYTLCEFNK